MEFFTCFEYSYGNKETTVIHTDNKKLVAWWHTLNVLGNCCFKSKLSFNWKWPKLLIV